MVKTVSWHDRSNYNSVVSWLLAKSVPFAPLFAVPSSFLSLYISPHHLHLLCFNAHSLVESGRIINMDRVTIYSPQISRENTDQFQCDFNIIYQLTFKLFHQFHQFLTILSSHPDKMCLRTFWIRREVSKLIYL